MKSETMSRIYKLLNDDTLDRRDRMLRAIEYGGCNRDTLEEFISEYRRAFNALEDFKDWQDSQKEE